MTIKKATLETYHAVWVIDKIMHLTTGENIYANSMSDALDMFKKEHGFEPWYIVKK